MIVDFSTQYKLEKTKKELLNIKQISDDDIFILQHITVNSDECESIKKYGILNRKEILKHDDFEIVKKLKEQPQRYKMMMNQKFDTNICAFLCANMNLNYNNNFEGLPEILSPLTYCYNMEKYKKYIITFKVKYMNIEKSGFFGQNTYYQNSIEKLKDISNKALKEVVILNKDYNVPVEDIIKIEKLY